MTGPAATSRDEDRVFIPCGDDLLAAVLTRPTGPDTATCIVYFAGRWSVTSTGRSFLFVYLARQLARFGYHSVRLDYLGIGDSTGEERPWELARPFTEEPAATMRWLEDRGLRDVVLVGSCGGARVILGSARHVDHLRGVVLLAPPVRDAGKGERTAALPTREFLRRGLSTRVLGGLRDPAKRRRYLHHARGKLRRLARPAADGGRRQGVDWVSPLVLDALDDLVQRRVPVLFLFGERDSYYDDFQRGRAGRLGTILEEAGDLVTVVEVEDRFFALTQTDMRRLTLDAIEPWLASARAGSASTPTGSAPPT